MRPHATRIVKMMQEEGLDAALLQSPENCAYVSGYAPHQLTVSRQPHFATVLLSADHHATPTIIGMDFETPSFRQQGLNIYAYSTWVGNLSLDEVNNGRTEVPFVTFFDTLSDVISSQNLTDKTIGIEMDVCSVRHYHTLVELFPRVTFVDISGLFLRARSIKQPDEILFMKELARVSDDALLFTSGFVHEGISERDLFNIYCVRAMASHVAFPSGWSSFTAGEQSSRLARSGDHIISSSDVVKFDGGVNGDARFYTTDFSRSWLMSKADPFLVTVKKILLESHDLMLSAIRPGLPFAELFRIGFQHTHQKFPFYRRGHLGHSISLGPQTHEAPYISPSQPGTCEAGMILCVENPLYIDNYNGFNIEDMVLITDSGCEVLTSLTPHWLDSEAKYR